MPPVHVTRPIAPKTLRLTRLRLIRRNSDLRPLFFIHIMRTGGTSFRSMLESYFDGRPVYPTRDDIARRGRYPELDEAINDRRRLTSADLVFGHYPYVLRSLWQQPPFTCVFLRDPVERTLSVLRFARLRRPQFDQDTPLRSVFEDDALRAAMIHNYQTKVLSIPTLDSTHGVNYPAPAEHVDPELAKHRLATCDFVGVTERFADSLQVFRQRTGLYLPHSIQTNQSQSQEPVTEALRDSIRQVVAYDLELVRFATSLLDSRLAGPRDQKS